MRTITKSVFSACRPQPNAIFTIRLRRITLETANLPTGRSRPPTLQLLLRRQRAGPLVALAPAQNRKYEDDRCDEQNIETSKNIPEVIHKRTKLSQRQLDETSVLTIVTTGRFRLPGQRINEIP